VRTRPIEPEQPSQLKQRFDIVRRLGAGGMGVVYEAHDRELDTRVAIKTLLRLTHDQILRLKHEFRALADLHHPNLVRLGELFEDEGRWFFTMELVGGVDVLRWVCGEESPPFEDVSTAPSSRRHPLVAPEELTAAPARYDEARLRAALGQMAQALSYLHDGGKVHRDIKPSNTLVTDSGRAVLLDFGVVADVTISRLVRGPILGTQGFMAPEVMQRRIGPEADWYSFGVLLYRLLTGRLPAADVREVLQRASLGLPQPSPRALAPDVPEDLDELCRALLSVDPAQRPTARQVLERLGAGVAPPVVGVAPLGFVGRQRELQTLEHAFEDLANGGTLVTLVEGESGVGKSALLREFLRRLPPSRALVLGGRCYERESVPYKAVDEVIDLLAEHLGALPAAELELLAPGDAGLVGELFPSLAPLFAASPPTSGHGDPQKRRRRAFAAVRELLRRVAERRPLVVAIDDLQWSDADSLQLLGELVRGPGAPRLLLVATVRSLDAARPGVSPADHLAQRLGREVRRVALGRLTVGDARQLIAQLAGADKGAIDFDAIERAAEGHPLFLDVLVRHRLDRGSDPAAARLEDALAARIERLTPRARDLLQLVSLAGGPLVQEAAALAAACDAGLFADTAAELRGAYLCRTGGVRPVDVIEPYHDRVRDSVVGALDARARRLVHHRLAAALESARVADSEVIGAHWRAAGDPGRARRYFVDAADDAWNTLAFDRAARLYRMALELSPPDDDATRRLRVRLGDALTNAGRGADAAEVYLRAAAGAPADESTELLRLAADQLLRSGRVDQGLATLRSVFAAVGLKLAPTPRRALGALLLRRAQVALRGTSFVERKASELTPRELLRLDLCWSVAVGLAMVDNIHGCGFLTLNLLLALRAGEPYRIARAIAFEACFSANRGVSVAARTARIAAEAQAIAARIGDPHALAWAAAARATACVLEGRWLEAGVETAAAEAMFRDCAGATWERNSITRLRVTTLAMLGRLAELQQLLPVWLRDAEEHGDLFATTNLRTGSSTLVWLAQDQPRAARLAVADAMGTWSQKGFYMQHYFELLSSAHIDLYEGDGRRAWERVSRSWPALTRSLLLRVQFIRCLMLHLRGRSAVAAALGAEPRQRRTLLAQARADARSLESERVGYADGFAELVRAGIASFDDPHAAVAALRRASMAFGAAAMSLYVAAARRCEGLLLGGDAGAALIRSANAAFAAEQVRDPARMTAMWITGRFESTASAS
jgi:eukaryotic-like serine/threonine-protein kinase